LQQDLVTTNIKKINAALQECTYLIDRYQSEERSSINPATGRQLVVDYKVTVYPTQVFQREQYRFNVHHKNIREHRVTAQGKAVIKPLRDQYPSRYDFEQYLEDKALFDAAKANIGSPGLGN